MRTLFIASALSLAPLLSSCAEDGDPEIEIRIAWARPVLASGHSTAVYMTIKNRGTGADRLIAARSEVAERVSFHISSNQKGVARMRAIEGVIEIPARGDVHFVPGGKHLMIEKIRQPIAPGGRIRVTLRFERSGEQTIEVAVRDALSGHSVH